MKNKVPKKGPGIRSGVSGFPGGVALQGLRWGVNQGFVRGSSGDQGDLALSLNIGGRAISFSRAVFKSWRPWDCLRTRPGRENNDRHSG